MDGEEGCKTSLWFFNFPKSSEKGKRGFHKSCVSNEGGNDGLTVSTNIVSNKSFGIITRSICVYLWWTTLLNWPTWGDYGNKKGGVTDSGFLDEDGREAMKSSTGIQIDPELLDIQCLLSLHCISCLNVRKMIHLKFKIIHWVLKKLQISKLIDESQHTL